MSARYTSMLLFADLQRQLNRVFERTTELHQTALRSRGWSPKIDVVEHSDRVIVSAEVPGIPASSLRVNLAGEILTIRGSKTTSLPNEVQGTFRCVERERGEFERHLRIGQVVDPESTRTRLANGLLTIELIKRSERRERSYALEIEEIESGENG